MSRNPQFNTPPPNAPDGAYRSNSRLIDGSVVTTAYLVSLKAGTVKDVNSLYGSIVENKATVKAVDDKVVVIGNKCDDVSAKLAALQNRIRELEDMVKRQGEESAQAGEERAGGRGTSGPSQVAGLSLGRPLLNSNLTPRDVLSGSSAGSNATDSSGSGSPMPSSLQNRDVVEEQSEDQQLNSGELAGDQDDLEEATNSIRGISPSIGVIGFKTAATLPPFNGNLTEDFTTFVRKFKDRLAASTEMDNDQKRSTFLLFLDNRARSTADGIIGAQPAITLEDLITKMSAVFENAAVQEHREEQLRYCTQQKGESVELFFQRIDKLQRLASTGPRSEEMKKVAFRAFLEGLGEHLNYAIRSRRPKDMAAALDEALHEEMLVNANVARRAVPTAAAYMASIGNQGKKQQQQKQSQSPKFLGEWHYCHKKGHKLADCRKRAADRGVAKSSVQNPVEHHQVKQAAAVSGTENWQLLEQNTALQAQVRDLAGRLERFQPSFDGSSGSNVCSLTWSKSKSFTFEDATPQQNSQSNSFITAHIPVKANQIPYSALVDTGANITVTSKDLLKGLGISRTLPMLNAQAVGLGGHTVDMVGSAVVQFKIGTHTIDHRVHFTTGRCMPEINGEYQFIIGNDMLSKLPMFVFNYKDALFHIGDDVLPLGQSFGQPSKPRKFNVKVCEDTIIPAGTEKYVKCSVSPQPKDREVILMIDSVSSGIDNLFVSPAVVMAQDAVILVSNPTDQDMTLNNSEVAASASQVTQHDGVLCCL